MRTAALPPVVAAIVALAVSAIRRFSALLVQSPASLPPSERFTMYLMSAQFVGFVLIYGLVFGVALGSGLRDADVSATSTALATGASATVAFLVGSAAVLWYLAPSSGAVLTAVFSLGASLGVGIQFAIVAYAGVSLGEGRRDEPNPTAA